MTVPPFRGFVTAVDGTTKWTWEHGEEMRWRAYMNSLKAGKWEIDPAHRPKNSRSLRQNAYIWGVAYPLIADSCGYDAHEIEQMHYDLLAVHFGTVATTPKIPSQAIRIVPRKTSSELTVEEFSLYMEWLVRYAATELHCVVPLPGDDL